MTLLQYELRPEERVSKPWRLATPVDVACLVAVVYFLPTLVSQAIDILMYSSTTSWASAFSFAAIPDLIAIASEISLIVLACVRLIGGQTFGLTMALLVALVGTSKVLRGVGELKGPYVLSAHARLSSFALISGSILVSTFVACGVGGKTRQNDSALLRRRSLMCWLLAVWICQFAAVRIIYFCWERFGELVDVPARAFVQPAILMFIGGAAAVVLARNVVRSRKGLNGQRNPIVWVAAGVVLAGEAARLWHGSGAWSAAGWVWYGMPVLSLAGMLLVAGSLATRPWVAGGTPGETPDVDRGVPSLSI